jgi:hypothetical protein
MTKGVDKYENIEKITFSNECVKFQCFLFYFKKYKFFNFLLKL